VFLMGNALFIYSVSGRKFFFVFKTWLISLKFAFIASLGLPPQRLFKFRHFPYKAYVVETFYPLRHGYV
jgi:hypothetical protein